MSAPAVPTPTPPAPAAPEVDGSAPFPLYTVIVNPTARIPGSQNGAPNVGVLRELISAWIPPNATPDSELRYLASESRAVVNAGGTIENAAMAISINRRGAAEYLIGSGLTSRAVEDGLKSIINAYPLTSAVYKNIISKR